VSNSLLVHVSFCYDRFSFIVYQADWLAGKTFVSDLFFYGVGLWDVKPWLNQLGIFMSSIVSRLKMKAVNYLSFVWCGWVWYMFIIMHFADRYIDCNFACEEENCMLIVWLIAWFIFSSSFYPLLNVATRFFVWEFLLPWNYMMWLVICSDVHEAFQADTETRALTRKTEARRQNAWRWPWDRGAETEVMSMIVCLFIKINLFLQRLDLIFSTVCI